MARKGINSGPSTPKAPRVFDPATYPEEAKKTFIRLGRNYQESTKKNPNESVTWENANQILDKVKRLSKEYEGETNEKARERIVMGMQKLGTSLEGKVSTAIRAEMNRYKEDTEKIRPTRFIMKEKKTILGDTLKATADGSASRNLSSEPLLPDPKPAPNTPADDSSRDVGTPSLDVPAAGAAPDIQQPAPAKPPKIRISIRNSKRSGEPFDPNKDYSRDVRSAYFQLGQKIRDMGIDPNDLPADVWGAANATLEKAERLSKQYDDASSPLTQEQKKAISEDLWKSTQSLIGGHTYRTIEEEAQNFITAHGIAPQPAQPVTPSQVIKVPKQVKGPAARAGLAIPTPQINASAMPAQQTNVNSAPVPQSSAEPNLDEILTQTLPEPSPVEPAAGDINGAPIETQKADSAGTEEPTPERWSNAPSGSDYLLAGTGEETPFSTDERFIEAQARVLERTNPTLAANMRAWTALPNITEEDPNLEQRRAVLKGLIDRYKKSVEAPHGSETMPEEVSPAAAAQQAESIADNNVEAPEPPQATPSLEPAAEQTASEKNVAKPDEQPLITNIYGVKINKAEPHLYLETNSELVAYGGSKDDQLKQISEYLKIHPGDVVYTGDENGHRIPWGRVDGNLSPGEPARARGIFNRIFGTFTGRRLAPPPDPSRFNAILK